MPLNGEKKKGRGVTVHRDVSTHTKNKHKFIFIHKLNSYFSIKVDKNIESL